VTRRKEPRRPRIRRTWTRNPVQRAHSTPQGAKGYSRAGVREIMHEEIRVGGGKTAHRPLRIVVLLSGEGRQLRGIFSQLESGMLEGEVVAVLSDNVDAAGLSAARESGIETVILDPAAVGDKDLFSEEINANLDRLNPDVVVLDDFAGPVRLKESKNRHVIHRAAALLEIAATD
jgi:hypothetical protein